MDCGLHCAKSMLDLPNILPQLLTFALTEDEDQSTECIGVPPPCYLLCVVVWRAIPDAIVVMSLLHYIPVPQTCCARVTRSFLLMGKGRPCQTGFLAAKKSRKEDCYSSLW